MIFRKLRFESGVESSCKLGIYPLLTAVIWLFIVSTISWDWFSWREKCALDSGDVESDLLLLRLVLKSSSPSLRSSLLLELRNLVLFFNEARVKLWLIFDDFFTGGLAWISA